MVITPTESGLDKIPDKALKDVSVHMFKEIKRIQIPEHLNKLINEQNEKVNRRYKNGIQQRDKNMGEKN